MNKLAIGCISFLSGALLVGLLATKIVISFGQGHALDSAWKATTFLNISKNTPENIIAVLEKEASCSFKMALEAQSSIWGHNDIAVQEMIKNIREQGISEINGCQIDS